MLNSNRATSWHHGTDGRVPDRRLGIDRVRGGAPGTRAEGRRLHAKDPRARPEEFSILRDPRGRDASRAQGADAARAGSLLVPAPRSEVIGRLRSRSWSGTRDRIARGVAALRR